MQNGKKLELEQLSSALRELTLTSFFSESCLLKALLLSPSGHRCTDEGF